MNETIHAVESPYVVVPVILGLLGLFVFVTKAFVRAMDKHNDALVEITRASTQTLDDHSAAIREGFGEVKMVHQAQLETLREVGKEIRGMREALIKRPCLIEEK